MTAIWREDAVGWRLLAPAGFPDEATLHGLVADAPQILPLAGSPRLTVIGREVLLGSNYADLIAVEVSGRPVVIEIKLARNAEARRAVIAQALTYAAYLRGLDPLTFETTILGAHLRRRKFDSLASAVAADDQEGAFDSAVFADGLSKSLGSGHFRLVVVLDEAPNELVTLIGYLGSVAEKLTIDLITVSAYDIGGTRVLVPQRVDADKRQERPAAAVAATSASRGRLVPGADDFEKTIPSAPEADRPVLHRLTNWARSLEVKGLVTLSTYHGTSGRWTLLPRLRAQGVGLVTIWNEHGAYLSVYRSVFLRSAPLSLPQIEALVAPAPIGQGNSIRVFSDELLNALTDAYKEAAGTNIIVTPG